MTPDDLTSLLRSPTGGEPRRTSDCPDETQIAGYVDGTLPTQEHERLERHLADCGACLALVGLLSRERNAPIEDRVPPDVLEQVASVKAPRSPRRDWMQIQRWAAAAMLVLVVPLLVFLGRPAGSPQPRPALPAEPSLRTLADHLGGLELLSPTPGSAVDAQQLDFRWTAIPGSPYYDVRIVSDDGELVAEQRVPGTEWRPPANLGLRPGAEYYVHVDAYPAGDKTLSSDHVPFRVAD